MASDRHGKLPSLGDGGVLTATLATRHPKETWFFTSSIRFIDQP
jgi:hypothetical protein